MNSRQVMTGLWSLAAAIWIAAALAPEARADDPHSSTWSSDGRVGRLVLQEVLSPIEDAARSSGAQLISLRVVDDNGSDRNLSALTDAIGNFFWDAGYEIQVRGPRTEVEEGAWTLDLTVRAAAVDSPRRRGSFLGLGQGKVLRRALVSLSGRLEDSRSGRWVWKGSPTVSKEAWIDADEDLRLSADRPQWAGAVPSPMAPSGASWWEKSVVAGLLAGVVTLYFSGAN